MHDNDLSISDRWRSQWSAIGPGIVERAILIVGATLTLFCLSDAVSAVDAQTRKASVICVVSETSFFPFLAGNDRCFKEINGKTSVYKSAAVCAVNTTEGPRLRFMYSTAPKAACVEGSPVTKKDDYSWGLAMLGPEEKAFFLKHVDGE